MIKKPVFPKFVLIPGFMVVTSNLDLAACLARTAHASSTVTFYLLSSAVMLMITESLVPLYLPESDPVAMTSGFPAVPAGRAETRRKDVFGDT